MIVDFTPRNANELQVIGGKGKMNARDHSVLYTYVFKCIFVF